MTPRRILKIGRLAVAIACVVAIVGAATGHPYVTAFALTGAISFTFGTVLGWFTADREVPEETSCQT